MHVPGEIQRLIDEGALFVVNHSAGKDSQAMFIKLRRIVPAKQLLVVHAILPEVEWAGVIEHIRDTIGGTPLEFARAVWRDGTEKTFFGMVEDRGYWPSPKHRQCTSDLKRGPIEKVIRRYLKAHPEFKGKIVSCEGLRAQESANRAKKTPLEFYESQSIAGREWWKWLPIFEMTVDEVFATIADAGEEPHWAYREGMTRLSCAFCIMASKADLTLAAILNPVLYARYVEMEKRLDQTFMMPVNGTRVFLEDYTGVRVEEVLDTPANDMVVQEVNIMDMAA